jgi:hypothetical protein
MNRGVARVIAAIRDLFASTRTMARPLSGGSDSPTQPWRFKEDRPFNPIEPEPGNNDLVLSIADFPDPLLSANNLPCLSEFNPCSPAQGIVIASH